LVSPHRLAQRVGFGCRFGVKLARLWAFEGTALSLFDGANRLKKLTKVAETGQKPQNVTNITLIDPERR
jgi:hypothetical protein